MSATWCRPQMQGVTTSQHANTPHVKQGSFLLLSAVKEMNNLTERRISTNIIQGTLKYQDGTVFRQAGALLQSEGSRCEGSSNSKRIL